MINAKIAGMLFATFVAGAFISSPELRAYAANTVGSADIINNSILSADIKDGEVKTVDLGGNAVTSAKIKDGEVKTADIATGAVAAGRIADGAVGTLKIADDSIMAVDIQADAVGASELQGVSKLIFAECTFTVNLPFEHGSGIPGFSCPAQGAATSDNAVAIINVGNGCFGIIGAVPTTNSVLLTIMNHCPNTQTPGTLPVSVIVFNK